MLRVEANHSCNGRNGGLTKERIGSRLIGADDSRALRSSEHCFEGHYPDVTIETRVGAMSPWRRDNRNGFAVDRGYFRRTRVGTRQRFLMDGRCPASGPQESKRDHQIPLQRRHCIVRYGFERLVRRCRLHGFIGANDLVVIPHQQARKGFVERIAVQ